MTKKEHNLLWQQPAYADLIKIKAAWVDADGCTGVPEFYHNGCLEHDIAYRTHRDPLGYKITQRTADTRFRWYIQHHSPFGIFSPMSWWRWLGVKFFGQRAWNHK